MPSSIDETYSSLLVDLPRQLHTVASRLPFHLGLSRHSDARWSDFVTLPPNRDLPLFAAPPEHLLPADLSRFNAAHHVAAYWGLVADRLGDRQVEPTPELLELREWLLQRWIDALTEATSDRGAAESAVETATRRWRRSLHSERDASAAGCTDLSDYVDATRDKLHWIATSACAMYPSPEDPRARSLRLAAELLLVACQLRDDALDDEDDRVLRGAGVASLLGLTPAELYRAAPRVVHGAAFIAASGGHDTLARWLRDHAVVINTEPPPGAGSCNELRAMNLSAAIALRLCALE